MSDDLSLFSQWTWEDADPIPIFESLHSLAFSTQANAGVYALILNSSVTRNAGYRKIGNIILPVRQVDLVADNAGGLAVEDQHWLTIFWSASVQICLSPPLAKGYVFERTF